MVLLAVAVVFSFAACEDDASDPWTIGVGLAKIEDASKPNFAANIEAIDKADAWTFKNNVLTIDITGLKLNDDTSIGDLSGTGLESTGAWVCTHGQTPQKYPVRQADSHLCAVEQ